MKNPKFFRMLYGVVCGIFLISCAALLFQVMELRRNRAFYAQWDAAAVLSAGAAQDAQGASDAAWTAAYADMVFWLQISQTAINYPVMQGADNTFYLHHLPDGTENRLGSLFLDCRTTEDSLHCIIYGHNGMNGAMFGALRQYQSAAFLAEHPAICLYTADGVYTCPIFSVRYLAANSAEYTPQLTESLPAYIARAAAQSLYPIAVETAAAQRIVTLSTCTERQNERLIIQAFLP